jgi:hypothetical protein
LKWYDGGRENGITLKKIFEVEVFFSSQNIDFPLIGRDSWGFSFSSSFFLFLSFSLLFFFAPSLEDSVVLMIFEEKITSSKISFQVASIYWRWMHILEWSYAR